MEKDISQEYVSLLRKADNYITDEVVKIFGENNDNIPLTEEVTFSEVVDDYSADLVTIDRMSTENGNLLVHIKERNCDADEPQYGYEEWQGFIFLDESTKIEIANNIKF